LKKSQLPISAQHCELKAIADQIIEKAGLFAQEWHQKNTGIFQDE